MRLSVVIAAGGTAGHVSPAIAVADAVVRARPEAAVCFVGTRRGLEGSLVPAAGYRLRLVRAMPFARTLGLRRYLAPARAVGATLEARRVLADEKAAAVVGMGGYASLPVVTAARLSGIPALVHEQNAVPGIANRIAARLTSHVALAFEEAASRLPRSASARVVGMPVRSAIARFDRGALRDEGLAAFGLRSDRLTLLVTGGSLGAVRLNRAAADIAGAWRDRSDRQLLVTAGRDHAESLAGELAALGGAIVVRCVPFIERMELAYAAADVILCRAGAATVAELAVAGLPSVLVPYPYSRGGHQAENAASLERLGAAVAIPDGEATGARLVRLLDEILADETRRRAMGDAALRAAKPRASEELAEWVLALAEGRRP